MKPATIADAPSALNLNDKAMWVLGYNAAAESSANVARAYVDMIHSVEQRCMAADGPVTPTHAEITDDELRKVYALAAATAGVQSTAEPIPANVYWAPLADNFYDADDRGQGTDFYLKWKPRRAEFPQGESGGWGPSSHHNPFKDPPRTAGVSGKENSDGI